MKKLNMLFGAVLVASLALFGATPAYAATPVIPEAPIVSQTYGSCVGGVFVIEPALVTLPAIQNGRWLDESDSAGFVVTKTFNSTPGEYTYGLITAEGDYYIPTSPGGAYDYRLEGGIAYYTITIDSAEMQNCGKVKKPKPVKPGLRALSQK